MFKQDGLATPNLVSQTLTRVVWVGSGALAIAGVVGTINCCAGKIERCINWA